MGAAAIFRDWICALTLLRARTGSTSPTRSADRSLPTSRCARLPPALPMLARLTPLHSPADFTCVCCLPEDGRARKVRIHSNPRCCLPFPQPQPLSFCRCTHKLAEVWNDEALGKASTSFTHPFPLPPRRCPDGCRQTKWCALFSRATFAQFFLPTPARVPFTGNREGHPCRCAYLL